MKRKGKRQTEKIGIEEKGETEKLIEGPQRG